MDNYYVSKKMTVDGYHLVHKEDCPNLPEDKEYLYLGYFSNIKPAVEKAKNFFNLVTGCTKCSKPSTIITDDDIVRK